MLEIDKGIASHLLEEEHLKRMARLDELRMIKDMQVFENLKETDENSPSKKYKQDIEKKLKPVVVVLRSNFMHSKLKQLKKTLEANLTSENQAMLEKPDRSKNRRANSMLVFKGEKQGDVDDKLSRNLDLVSANIKSRAFSEFTTKSEAEINQTDRRHKPDSTIDFNHKPCLTQRDSNTNVDKSEARTSRRELVSKNISRSQSTQRNSMSTAHQSAFWEELEAIKSQRQADASEFSQRTRLPDLNAVESHERTIKPSSRSRRLTDEHFTGSIPQKKLKSLLRSSSQVDQAADTSARNVRLIRQQSESILEAKHPRLPLQRHNSQRQLNLSQSKQGLQMSYNGDVVNISQETLSGRVHEVNREWSPERTRNYYQRYAEAKQEASLRDRVYPQKLTQEGPQSILRSITPLQQSRITNRPHLQQNRTFSSNIRQQQPKPHNGLAANVLNLKFDDSKSPSTQRLSIYGHDTVQKKDKGHTARKKIWESILG